MAHTLFPTAFGTCGLSWNEAGLTGFRLPERTDEETLHRLKKGDHDKPADLPRPGWVRRLVRQVQQHLEGQLQDFPNTPFDWSRVGEFQQAAYRQAREIKPGSLRSYGQLARQMGLDVRAARAVGRAMATNPWPLIVPCHRVVSARNKLTGYSAAGGIRTKARLLVLEGADLLSE